MNQKSESAECPATPTLGHLYRLTRPYSWVCSTAVSVAAWVFSGGGPGMAALLIPLSLSALLWVGLNWLSDSIQRDAGRVPPPAALLLATLALSLALAAVQSASACAWALIHYLLVLAYARKKHSAKVGAVSYLLRGGTVFAACASVGAAANGAWFPQGDAFWFIASQSLAHAARNLIGDIRDMKTDRYELPVTHGAKLAVVVAVVCLVAAGGAALMMRILVADTTLFIVALLLGVLWLMLYGRRLGYDIAGRRLHHLMVFVFSAFTLWCSYRLGVWWGWVSIGSGLLIALHMTYYDNPGKSFRAKSMTKV